MSESKDQAVPASNEEPGEDGVVVDSDEVIFRRRRAGRLLIGAVTLVFGLAYTLKAQDYRWGEIARPGPALFPTLLGVALVLIGLLILINAGLGRNLHEGDARDQRANRRLALLCGCLVVYVAGLYTVGFTLSSLVLTYAMLHILESSFGRVGRIVYSVALVVCTELLFTWLFNISFPGGWFGFLR